MSSMTTGKSHSCVREFNGLVMRNKTKQACYGDMALFFVAPLLLKQPPMVTQSNLNRSAQIVFELIDTPKPNIKWLFNGTPIQLSLKYQMTTYYQVIFNIDTIDSNDTGTYTAVIEDGTSQMTVPVNITIQGNI